MDLSQYTTSEVAVAMVFTGIVVVFCALVGLWFIVALFGKFFSNAANKPKTPSQPTPPPAPVVKQAAPASVVKPAMQVEDGIGDEIVAVIAAAVSTISGGTAAVRSVKRVREARSGWAQAGVVQNTQSF